MSSLGPRHISQAHEGKAQSRAAYRFVVVIVHRAQQAQDMHSDGQDYENVPDRVRVAPDIKLSGVVAFWYSTLFSGPECQNLLHCSFDLTFLKRKRKNSQTS